MSQHFLLRAEARSLSLVEVMQMTEAQAEAAFRKVRWPDTQGEAVCPSCGSPGLLRLPQAQRCPAVALQGLPCRLQHHVRDAVRFPQDAAALLPRGNRDLLQRGQG